MSEWSSGYVVDVGYTHGFYQELTPSFLGLLSLIHGFRSPGLDDEPLTYCELGCGQGFSTNLLAAANPHIQFYATDFNPSHIAGAQALAQSARLKNVHFSDDSFAEFLNRDDLPDFDFITLHGIYSWISAENRQAIVQFIRKKLKPGGVVYISYNAMPGWAAVMPLRRLLVEHAEAQGSSRPLLSRISNSLEFAKKLSGLDTRYFASHPKLASRVDSLKGKNLNYIAHEYFNKDLPPFYFTDLAQELSGAKLTWVGSASVLDTIDSIHMTEEQRQFLSEIDNVALRQTVRDHIIDQQFRRDIFIKGPAPLAKGAATEMWLDTRFALTCKSKDIPKQLTGLRYKAELRADLYDPLIAALEKGPQTLRDVMAQPDMAKTSTGRVIQAISYLVALGACHPCLPQQSFAERKIQTDRFNKAVAEEARYSPKFSYFASGVTGSGISVDRVNQLIWLALHNKEKDVPEFVRSTLSKMGHKLVKDGKVLATPEENLAEIRGRMSVFEEDTMPLWRAIGISPEAPSSSASEEKRMRA